MIYIVDFTFVTFSLFCEFGQVNMSISLLLCIRHCRYRDWKKGKKQSDSREEKEERKKKMRNDRGKEEKIFFYRGELKKEQSLGVKTLKEGARDSLFPLTNLSGGFFLGIYLNIFLPK